MTSIDSAEIAKVITPLVEGLGLDLESVTIKKAGRRTAIVIVVDKDGGVDLDLVAAASSQSANALEESDATGDLPYVLEVTSPGVDRPLTQPRHWRRAVRRLVNVTLTNDSTVSGRVVSADETSAEVETAAGVRRVEFTDVARAVVQIEFSKDGGS